MALKNFRWHISSRRPRLGILHRLNHSTGMNSSPSSRDAMNAGLKLNDFQLVDAKSKTGQAESLFQTQTEQDLEDWWATSRFAGIKRPYSAQDVASKSGTLRQSYPSSSMARKLFDLLKERAKAGEPVHTSALS